MPTGKHVLQKNLRVILPIAFAVLAAGCSTLHVATDYNPATNFHRYHTYSWLRVQAENSLWEDRIRRGVNAQLAGRGWQEVPTGGQAVVSAFESTEQVPSLQTYYSSFGPYYGGWGWDGGWGAGAGFGYGSSDVIYTPVGSLVVDIFNAGTKRLIWRGTATQELSDNPQKNTQKVENAIAKMFEKFPPPELG